MDGFFDFLGNYWWLVFPFGGFIWAGIGGVGSYLERGRRERHEMRMERLRLRHGVADGGRAPAVGVATASATDGVARDLARVLAAHDAVSRRWLDHELDAAKVIDFPLMTDMREPLTRDFHRAKRTADALRPQEGEQPDARPHRPSQ